MTDEWISAETEPKEHDFAGILRMHIQMCKGILGRQAGPPYLYVDCHAGPGHLEYKGRRFDGSPLIFQDIATREGIRYRSLHFEQDQHTAARLAEALYVPTSLIDCPTPEQSPIHVASCELGLPAWLAEQGSLRDQYGLVYADPIAKEIPHAMLDQVAKNMPRVDLLAYVGATAYKRRRGVDKNRARLVEHIRAIDKRHVLIRKGRDRQQWTFILWTNWGDFPEWERRQLHRLDSEAGQRILDELNLTAPELHAKRNTPLPLDDDPPYRTYREYLRHPRFLAIRAEVFQRAGGKCERCGLRPPRDPHHLRYPPWGEFDVPENLIAICRQCHCEIHGKAA
jgi:three-Cys-motif partner protein